MNKSKNLNNFRLVANKRRANLLNKRGEFIFWDKVHECWVWKPEFRQKLLTKLERLNDDFYKTLYDNLEDLYATSEFVGGLSYARTTR